eukprot:6711411-Pyramimonas_sp.AAC.1
MDKESRARTRSGVMLIHANLGYCQRRKRWIREGQREGKAESFAQGARYCQWRVTLLSVTPSHYYFLK